MQVMRYHDIDGNRIVLAEPKRTRIQVIGFDVPIRVQSVPMNELRFMRPIDIKVSHAARHLRAFGRRHGITKGARKMLRGK